MRLRCSRPYPRRERDRPRVAGFTLIELLVALTLLGLVSVILFGGLRFGTRAWEAGNARSEQLGEVQAVQALLRRRLAQAVLPRPVPGSAVRGRRAEGFRGESDSLRFLAPAPSRFGVGGYYWFDIAVVEDGEAPRLELAWRLYRADEPDRFDALEEGLSGRRVLIEGFERAAFAYYGAARGAEAPDWRDDWDRSNSLPGLIAVTMEFPEGDRRSWPDLMIAPRLARID